MANFLQEYDHNPNENADGLPVAASGTSQRSQENRNRMNQQRQRSHRAAYLLWSFQTLREELFGCDFEIIIGKERIPVHRLILAASSQHFKGILGPNTRESKQGYVKIQDLNFAAVKASLHYLYTGEVDLHFEEIEQILKVSYVLQFDDLKELILTFFLEELSAEKSLTIRRYGMMYDSEMVIQASEDYIGRNFEAVASTAAFQLLDEPELRACLKLQQLKSAAVSWRAVTGWVNFDVLTRGDHLLGLLKSIGPIDMATIFCYMLTSPIINLRQECAKYLTIEFILENLSVVGDYLNNANIFELQRWSSLCGSEQLKKKAHHFMLQNFQTIAVSRRIAELEFNDITALIMDENSKGYDEKLKFYAIAGWARGKVDKRLLNFEELFRRLELERISIEFIHNEVRKEQIVKSSLACSHVIMDALFKHARKRVVTTTHHDETEGRESTAHEAPDSSHQRPRVL